MGNGHVGAHEQKGPFPPRKLEIEMSQPALKEVTYILSRDPAGTAGLLLLHIPVSQMFQLLSPLCYLLSALFPALWAVMLVGSGVRLFISDPSTTEGHEGRSFFSPQVRACVLLGFLGEVFSVNSAYSAWHTVVFYKHQLLTEAKPDGPGIAATQRWR